MSENWECWKADIDEKGRCRLVLDVTGQSQNTLSGKVLDEFESVLNALESKSITGLVIASGKTSGFMVGADVHEISDLYEDAVLALARRGHQALDRIEALPYPTVAEINGLCIGGGLEIALACDFRIALADAQFGLPEVQLGLHPGLGGTYRLPRTIAGPEALKLMLTGKSISAREAKELGLIDDAVEERHLQKAVETALDEKDEHSPFSKVRKAVELSGPARALMVRTARQKTEKRAPKEHYPAPYAILDLFEHHGGDRAMLDHEARSFAKLTQDYTAKNLIHLFKLRDKLKREARSDEPLGIERIHVIGAGTMGGDIAAWAALKGFEVTLEDIDRQAIAAARQRAADLFERETPSDSKTTPADRLTSDEKGRGAAYADLIIEAAPENEEIKGKIYAQLAEIAPDDAIIATNTSSLPLEKLSKYFTDGERLVGLHFFNPVAKLPLVEIVRGKATSDETFKKARAFAEAVDKLPLPVKSAPGFLVNRVLTPYLLEAVRLIDDGVAAATIDKAAEDFGMQQGPVEVADNVGLDVCLHVGRVLAENLDGVNAPPETLKNKVENGDLGRKSGKGFYEYEDGKPKKGDADEEKASEIQKQLITPLFEAALACLDDEVVANADLLDAGVVFGAGFAPFHGGPATHIRTGDFDASLKARLMRIEGDGKTNISAA